jgi:hypothetical protein
MQNIYRGAEGSMDTIPYYTSTRINSLKAAADSWVSSTCIKWDIAACWHLPLSDLLGDVENVEMRVGTKLRRYFNTLDRRIFKAKHKKGTRIKRFITLEHAASVGWHVHGILETPQHIDQHQFISAVKNTWVHCVKNDKIGLPRSHLAWCEPIETRYPQYTTKHSFAPLHRAKGTIDPMNTYFGEDSN